MSKRDHDKKTGSWRSLHTAVWLIGLAILFWKGWWWPGILVLIAISMALETLIPQMAAGPAESRDTLAAPPAVAPVAAPEAAPVMPPPASLPAAGQRLELLPAVCPSCGGPIRGHEVRWTGPQSADCPYCGTNLPMKKASGAS